MTRKGKEVKSGQEGKSEGRKLHNWDGEEQEVIIKRE